MSIPTRMDLTELFERTQSLADSYYEILSSCDSVDEIASLNSWYLNAIHGLWILTPVTEQAA
ncbi:hypothetical protein [Amphritea pacifica]|uniref:ClbS/DfsB family four-helix bundle protein n=1 Tax=Amphritea pacifica TaxID=2811233 RepID=A0ABS2WDI7_9GAMM|nr:hypothetical protein [Amphritea pacifica]MBN0989779.1 hypothetical protein [Amphritea pacifica]MBN1007811.1 hypothetical protein [Amphritea pacifica]